MLLCYSSKLCCSSAQTLTPSLSAGKPFIPKNPQREIPKEEQITLEPELEEALANATEAEMCDIAGEGPGALGGSKPSLLWGHSSVEGSSALPAC